MDNINITNEQKFKWLESFYSLQRIRLLESIEKIISDLKEICEKQSSNYIAKNFYFKLENYYNEFIEDSEKYNNGCHHLTMTELYTKTLEASYDAERNYLKETIAYYKKFLFEKNETTEDDKD